MKTNYAAALEAMGMEFNPETEFWSKHIERDGFAFRLSAFNWTAAGRVALRVHTQGRREELCRWTIGALEPEGSVMWLARYDMGDLRRWSLPIALRGDLLTGHQVKLARDLARLGHTAAIVLGVWDQGWSRIYVLPVTALGLPAGESPASRTWDELEPYLTRRPIEALRALADKGAP